VAEIRIVGFNFAPRGWAFCDGQILPIAQNTALFSLLGTTYGGDGKSNFALPNLQGRAPMAPGQGPGLTLRDLGEAGGTEAVTLTASEMPFHNHASQGVPASSQPATSGDPAGHYLAAVAEKVYRPLGNLRGLGAVAGASQPHNNLQPYLVLNFIIALQGVYPPRSAPSPAGPPSP